MLEQLKALFSVALMSAKSYINIIIVVILLLASYEGWKYYQKYVKSQITVLQQNILDRDKKIAAITEEFNKLAAAKKDVEVENEKLKN